MSRNRSGMCGRHDEPDDIRDASRSGRPVRATVLTWSGLITLGVLACGMALLAHDSLTGRPEGPARGRMRHLPAPLGAVAFAPDGKALALGYTDGSLEIQDLCRGRPLEIEPGSGLPSLRGVAFSPDGKTLASARGPSVKFWDAATGEPLGSLDGLSSPVVSLAFSPDGKALATGSLDGSVRLWDVAGGRESARIAGHSGEVRGLAFAPDGKALASGSFDGSVRLWDVADGRERAGVDGQGRRVYGLAFAPDGKALAISLGASIDSVKGMVVVWDLAGGPRPVRVIGESSFASVAFAPDGKTLAVGGGDRVVKLWDLETGEVRASLTGHEGFIASLAYSPDGRFLATGGQDSRLGLFELGPEPAKSASHRL